MTDLTAREHLEMYYLLRERESAGYVKDAWQVEVDRVNAHADPATVGAFRRLMMEPPPPPRDHLESAARHTADMVAATRLPISLGEALAGLAEMFLDMGCDPADVESAFASVMRQVAA